MDCDFDVAGAVDATTTQIPAPADRRHANATPALIVVLVIARLPIALARPAEITDAVSPPIRMTVDSIENFGQKSAEIDLCWMAGDLADCYSSWPYGLLPLHWHRCY